MPNQTFVGSAYLINGAVTGGLFAAKIGRIGIIGGFGGASLGALPIVGAGAIIGAATYGALTALAQGDRTAIGSVGLGIVGGMGISHTIGSLGVAGSFGAFKFGLGSFGMAGGVVGLGVYGLAKMLDSGPQETAHQAFDRMAAKIDEDCLYQQAYTEAFLELTLGKDDQLVQFLKWDADAELERVKVEFNRQQQHNLHRAEIQERPFGTCLHTLHHHSKSINAIALHPNGTLVATGSDDHSILLWDLISGNVIHYFCLTGPVQAIAISLDGKTLIGSNHQDISIWNLESYQYIGTFRQSSAANSHKSLVQCLAMSRDSQLAFSGSYDRTIRVWRNDHRAVIQEKLKRTLKGHEDTIFSMVVSRDGQHLASGSADSTLRIWSLSGWSLPQVILTNQGWVNTIGLNDDETMIASGGSDSTIKIWDFQTGKELVSFKAHQTAVRSLTFNPRSNVLASIGNDREIKIWSIKRENSALLKVRCLHTFSGTGILEFSHDGSMLINAQDDGKIQIWHLR